jgi:myosin-5
MSIGLQTPRLKRLAEIVSAQAIAQQEKLENPVEAYDSVDEGQDQEQDLADDVGVNGV